MKKVLMYEYGDVDVLKEENVPIPEPKDNEVQIKIIATSVNDPDISLRQYGPFPTMPKEMRPVLPHMAGEDFSGIITATGKDVQRYKEGEHVIGITLSGTTAEYITLNENSLIYKIPDEVDLVSMGAIGVTVATAWAAVVSNGKVTNGQKVLIHGAAGGVGSMAVQFAKYFGAYVIATAGGYSKDYLKDLGADEVIDYRTEDFTKVVKDADLVVNLTGSETLEKSYQVVKKGGILTSTNGMPDMDKAKAFGINANYTMGFVTQEDVDKIIAIYKEGKLKINITKTYPFELESIKQAHLDFEKGPNQGKRLIIIEA